MNTFTPNGGARPPRGLRHLGSYLRARLARVLAFARAWQWGAVVGRVTLAAMGLVLLGAIGHSAFARNMLEADTMLHVDAGADAAPPTLTPTSLALASAPAVSASPPSGAPPESTASPGASTPIASAQPARGRATADDPVYLNQATLSDLHRLPGVGPKRAEAILALRTKLGHFRQVEDLLKVKGIGRSSLRKLRPLVRLDSPPGGSSDAATPPPP